MESYILQMDMVMVVGGVGVTGGVNDKAVAGVRITTILQI